MPRTRRRRRVGETIIGRVPRAGIPQDLRATPGVSWSAEDANPVEDLRAMQGGQVITWTGELTQDTAPPNVIRLDVGNIMAQYTHSTITVDGTTWYIGSNKTEEIKVQRDNLIDVQVGGEERE